MAQTKIEWTDKVWNPDTGCTKVSQGCKNCYAEREWKRLSANPKTVYFGREFTNVQCHPHMLLRPLQWKKPARIFVNSMSDLFHEEVPQSFIDNVYAVMALCSQHTFQILTKRPERMQEYLLDVMCVESRRHDIASAATHFGYVRNVDALYDSIVEKTEHPLPNVWFGVSVEDQATANERIPVLINTPAAVRWISAEPLLAPVDLEPYIQGLDWVVVGGETGKIARPVSDRWIKELLNVCETNGKAFNFKQWGEWHPVIFEDGDQIAIFNYNNLKTCEVDGYSYARVGKRNSGRLLNGVLYDNYPDEVTA